MVNRMSGNIVLLSLVTLMSMGCASIKYEPVRLDASIATNPCEAQAATTSDNCSIVLVKASRWETLTGIQVASGEHICVQVPDGQFWFDKDRRNVPPKGEPGNWLMNRFKKREPDADFFSLIVNTKQESNGQLSIGHPVEKTPLYISKHSGELVFYPNDAVGGATDPAFFYKNNAGQIWVVVRRCVGACTCLGTANS